jgi:CheY-like chemotaxis protein
VRAYLEDRYDLVEVADGGAALDTMARVPIDLVLLDVFMPGMTGFDVCRQIRAMPGRPIPVVFLTAANDAEIAVRAASCGANEVLVKPLRHGDVLDRVRGLLATLAD